MQILLHGLSGFEPEKTAIQAGRIMLKRIQELAEQKTNFAFETTLASRSFINLISTLTHILNDKIWQNLQELDHGK